MMAYHNGLAVGIEFAQPRWDIAHRDMSRAGKSRDRDFARLANVEYEHALAAIDARLERYRIYISNFRQFGISRLAIRSRGAHGLTSFENSSTFENLGSSVHEIENAKVSV